MSYYSLRTQRDLREIENHLLLLPMTQLTTATNGRDEHRLSKSGLETVGAQWGSQWVGRFPCSIQRWVVPAAALASAPSPQLMRLPAHSRHFGCPLAGGLQDKLLPQLLLEHGGGLLGSLAKRWSVQEQYTHVGARRSKSSCSARAASVVPGTGACTELLCEPPGWQAGHTSAAAGLNRRWVATRNPLWAVLSTVEQVGPTLGHSHDTTQLSLRGKTPFPPSWETRWHPLSSEPRQWFTHWWVS